MIPEFITQRMNRGLLYTPDNPIGIVKNRLCQNLSGFKLLEKLDPVVDKEDNFDLLKYPGWHVARRQQKTFYCSKNEEGDNGPLLLRTAMASHLSLVHYQYTEENIKNIALCGEVFNNCEIDPVKYPITHQISLFSIVGEKPHGFPKITQAEMKKTIRMLMNNLIADNESLTYSFDSDIDVYHCPFLTDCYILYLNINKKDPLNEKITSSVGIRIGYGGKIKHDVMESLGASLGKERAWFFTINLDRLAMSMFDINDIRLLWSCDTRFTDQFKSGVIKKFKSFSDYKVHSIFVPLEVTTANLAKGAEFVEEQICDIVRDTCGDMAEEVFKTSRNPIWIGSSRREYFAIRFRCIHKELSAEEIEYMKSQVKLNIEKAGFKFILDKT